MNEVVNEGIAWHAAFNATLNSTSALLIVLGYRAIKRKSRAEHKRFMLSAFVVSTLFLVSYLIRFALEGTHRFPGDGLWKVFYLTILFTHMIAAAVVPILTIGSIRFALRNELDKHRAWVRFAFPVWLYVSVTGVLVYILLYHFPNGAHVSS